MSFKNQIEEDILNIFLNEDEFADMHNINGQQILCVVDEDDNKIPSSRESEQYDGISLSAVKVFVKASLLPKKPMYGKLFKLDDKPYIVMECKDNVGMYEITLGLNDS